MPPGGESHSGAKIPWPETAVRVRFPPGAQRRLYKLMIFNYLQSLSFLYSPNLVTIWSPSCSLPLVASLTDTPGASPPSIVQGLQDYAIDKELERQQYDELRY